MPEHSGVIHNFAETVAAAYEDSDTATQALIEKDWLDKADQAIQKALELDKKYAKFYCTQGRLLAIYHQYDDAKEALNRAIDLEDSTKKDYVIRLGNYQYFLLLIQSIQPY